MNNTKPISELAKIIEALLIERGMSDAHDLYNVVEMMNTLSAHGLGFRKALHATVKFMDLFLLRGVIQVGDDKDEALESVIEAAFVLNKYGANLSTKELEKYL